MLGWRARIGLLVPATNTVAENEFWAMIPEGVTIGPARVVSIQAGDEHKRLAGYRSQVMKAAQEVKHIEPSIIAWTCTSGSFIDGAGYDQKLVDEATAITGAPAVTTSTAVMEAIRHLGIRKLAMGTPYRDSITQVEKEFFERSMPGLRIVSTRNLSVLGPGRRGHILPETVYDLGRSVDTPEAEAVFLSCTDVRTREVLEYLERDLGKPVISSNQSTLWAILRRLGIETRTVVGRLGRCSPPSV